MHGFKPLPFDMRIDLGRRNIGMTEQCLHRSKIRTALQQMGGKRMSQDMGGNLFADTRTTGSLTEGFPKSLPGQRSTATRDEDKSRKPLLQ